MAWPSVIPAREAVQHGVLPGAELGLQFLGEGGLLLDEIVLFSRVGLEIEEFVLGIALLWFLNHELELAVDDGAGAKVVGCAERGMAEVLKVASGFAPLEFDERCRPFLQLGIDVGLHVDAAETVGVVGPEVERFRDARSSFRRAMV